MAYTVGGGEKYHGEREREREEGGNMVFIYCLPIIIETYASPEVPATVF